MAEPEQEEALLAAALKGSASAWDALVRRYERRVYNYGLRLTGNPNDAMDLMQEVFIGVYRNLHRFRGDAQFTSWLFRIAHNKAVDMSRKRRTVSMQDLPHRGDDSGEAQDYENIVDHCATDPQQKILDDEDSARVVSLLGSLPWEQRLIVELKVYQSLTFEEIAEMQGLPVNTAKTRFYSALKKLQTKLEQTDAVS